MTFDGHLLRTPPRKPALATYPTVGAFSTPDERLCLHEFFISRRLSFVMVYLARRMLVLGLIRWVLIPGGRDSNALLEHDLTKKWSYNTNMPRHNRQRNTFRKSKNHPPESTNDNHSIINHRDSSTLPHLPSITPSPLTDQDPRATLCRQLNLHIYLPISHHHHQLIPHKCPSCPTQSLVQTSKLL